MNAYEMGERVPGADSVRSLARVLDFPMEFFGRERIEALHEDTVSFRALSKMLAARRSQALASGTLAMELDEWIGNKFELPPVAVPDLYLQKSPEVAAQALRVQWGLGDQPIPNMVRLLESKGVRVFSLAEDNKELDAFSFWRDEKPYVFLNTLKSAERSRFDAAHELGHLVLHKHGAPHGRVPEIEANAFASAFLMPRTSVLAYAPRNATLPMLVRAKAGWRVSVAALAYRLHDVGLISEWHYRSLAIQIQTHGYRDHEPDPLPREMSQIWPQIFAALKSEGISRVQLASMLAWPLSELRSLVFQLVLSGEPGGGGKTPKPIQRPSMHLIS